MVDVFETIAAKSDQQNADDYVGGPKTVTVADVKLPGGDQPMHLHLVEFPGKPYKPAKTMRRVLVNIWGPETAAWAGRKLTLYRDDSVTFGGETVGGIRISHMSHIDKPVKVMVDRRKRAYATVFPLETGPDPKVVAEVIETIQGAESLPALKTAWELAGVRGVARIVEVVAAKDARKAELTEATS